MPRELRDSVVIITGASAGIGQAIARELHRGGARLVLSARRVDRLAALNDELGGRHLTVQCDVSQSADCQSLVDRTIAQFGRIDTLICNAGYGLVRRVHQMTDAEFDAIWRTNVVGTTACMRAAVPYMQRNDVHSGWRGQIVVISSAAARRGLPFFGAYAATKAAQLSLAEAARVELRRSRIAVTSVHPVGTESDFFRTAETVSRAVIDVPSRRGIRQTSEHVARRVVAGMRRPRPEVWPLRPSRVGLLLAALMPSMADRAMRRPLRDIEARQAREGSGGSPA